MSRKTLPAVSLFSGAGIGDLGFRAAGMDVLAQCEIEPDRAALAALNFPDSHVLVADLWQAHDRFAETVTAKLRQGQELFLLCCTAPCQGMSKSGQGTLLNNVRAGKRPTFDPRNRLILPALRIIKQLRPRWVVFENVAEMRHTLIHDETQQTRLILDVIFETLSPEYAGRAYDVEFADHGIAQRRQRLITVLTRDRSARRRFAQGTDLVPPPTHAKITDSDLKCWVSVSEALADYPALDAVVGRSICADRPFHRVPVLDPKKYEWIRHIRPGRSAFDNQCINRECGFKGNRTHGARRDGLGINRARRDTPLLCEKCGALLPRPYVEEGGTKRLMSGYASAYKRMDADLPAPALTRNLSYPCSDQKLHPTQNRVLSLAEAMTLHTIDRYAYHWGPIHVRRGKRERTEAVATDSLIRLVIGESVPPLYFERLGTYLLALAD